MSLTWGGFLPIFILGLLLFFFVVAQLWNLFEISICGWWIIRSYRTTQTEATRSCEPVLCEFGWTNNFRCVGSATIKDKTIELRLDKEDMWLAYIVPPIVLPKQSLVYSDTKRGGSFALKERPTLCVAFLDKRRHLTCGEN